MKENTDLESNGRTFLLVSAADVPYIQGAAAGLEEVELTVLGGEGESSQINAAASYALWYASDGLLGQSESPGDPRFADVAEAATVAQGLLKLGGRVLKFTNLNGPQAPDLSGWQDLVAAARQA